VNCISRPIAALIGPFIAVALFSDSAAAQVLKADYQFQHTLASAVTGAPPLVNIAENSFAQETVDGRPRVVLKFPEGSGVALNKASGVIPGGVYTIIMQFRFATITGYRRLIDFKNGTVDEGLYTLNGALHFYNITGGVEPLVQPDVFVQVMITRDRQKRVCGYVNGRLQFSFTDEGDQAVANNGDTLRFFRDDGPMEQSAGAVARIRIYSGALIVAEAGNLKKSPAAAG
jgi:concanavalin A-like lectin/glucanase superfamily protein